MGMLKGTAQFNPVRHPEAAAARRAVVLAALATTGAMPRGRARTLAARPLGLRFERLGRPRNRAPHFVEAVRKQAEAWAESEGLNLYGDGLTIHTTLVPALQEAAIASVVRAGDALQDVADVEWGRAGTGGASTRRPLRTRRRGAARRPSARSGARSAQRSTRSSARVRSTRLPSRRARAPTRRSRRSAPTAPSWSASARPRRASRPDSWPWTPATGGVLAYVGSRDSRRAPFDHVASARRQPGSTFKAFVYARALEEGFRPDDTLPNEPVEMVTESGEVWRPRNADGEAIAGKEVTLREGLAKSVNTAAAQLIEAVGPSDVARTARRMGVRSPLQAVPSLALGTSDVTLLEMASAYATIADGGLYRPPVFITSVTDAAGRELARFTPEPRQALDPSVALTLVDMLRGVVDRGTGRALRSTFGARGDWAGKTGTTQNGCRRLVPRGPPRRRDGRVGRLRRPARDVPLGVLGAGRPQRAAHRRRGRAGGRAPRARRPVGALRRGAAARAEHG